MNRRFFLAFLAGLVVTPARSVDSAVAGKLSASPLRLGIVPFNPATALLRTHQPLREHLERVLGRSVMLYSSPDHALFFQDTQNGRFDVVVTSPHLGVIHMEQGFAPLVRYQADMEIRLVVRKRDRIKRPVDLLGKRVGVPDRMSIFSIGGIRWLQNENLQLDRDYQLSEWPNHGSLIAAVAQGSLDAALSTTSAITQAPQDVREKLASILLRGKIPHLMSLARPEQGEAEIARIRKAFESFPTTPAGREFFLNTGYKGYAPITADDVEAMRPYVEMTRELMEKSG
jgi:phosphonate transport system substrate-binding protein